MLNIDPNTLLAVEVTALAVLVALGIWRIMRKGPKEIDAKSGEVSHDMRRDGQQLGA